MDGIVLNAMAIEQREEFAVEPMGPMMMFLMLDVVPKAAIVEWRDAEGTIAMLPSEVAAMGKVIMDPFRGRGLDAGYQIRHGEGARRLDV
jgi:hypothetical protein